MGGSEYQHVSIILNCGSVQWKYETEQCFLSFDSGCEWCWQVIYSRFKFDNQFDGDKSSHWEPQRCKKEKKNQFDEIAEE